MRALPCVVQVGFAGSRRLIGDDAAASDRRSALDLIEGYVIQQLQNLPADLKLSSYHFLCGISQLAAGGDQIFTSACRTLGIPQRVFLPQHRDAYLSAIGSEGEPDFSQSDRAEALALLESPHVIQERVVSDAPDRASRFEDCNREILRVSDVVICLLPADGVGRRGGTDDLLRLAQRRKKPCLEVRVELDDGVPVFTATWHDHRTFSPPSLPGPIRNLTVRDRESGGEIDVAEFCKAVKSHVSEVAGVQAARFTRAAMLIISGHTIATLFAALALKLQGEAGEAYRWVATLLSIESVLLGVGLGIHLWLRRTGVPGAWAMARLLAEINRSVRSLGGLHIYLEYLFRLDLPPGLSPLLRTLNVIHLRSTRGVDDRSWQDHRAAYLRRLTDPDIHVGQLGFYRTRCKHECRMLRWTRTAFFVCTSVAVTCACLKVAALTAAWSLGGILSWLGVATVFLPVVAVGTLAWAAAKEYEVRLDTFGDMVTFLEVQQELLENAQSAREFAQLVQETETRLLAETAQWYLRTRTREVYA